MSQLIANSIVSGSLYSAIGLSFWLIYRSAKFFHFAHAATITFGAYACYLAVSVHLPISASVAVAAVLSACLGGVMQTGVLRPLTRRGARRRCYCLRRSACTSSSKTPSQRCSEADQRACGIAPSGRASTFLVRG